MKDINKRKEKIGILLPAYNEEKTIKDVIIEFHNALPEAEICVIDNASTDNTASISRDTMQSLMAPGKVIFEAVLGKGNAIRRAFIELDWDIYIMVDTDLTYSSVDLPYLLRPVIENSADIVVGNRYPISNKENQRFRRFHKFGNNLVKSIINFVFNTNLNDIFSGYRVMNKRFIKNMPLLTDQFEIETEMSIYALINKFRIQEIPISYKDRIHNSHSKLKTYKDGKKVLKTILMIIIDYKPLFFFGSLSIIFFLLGLLFGSPVIHEYIVTKYITHVPLAILSTGLVIISIILFTIAIILNVITRLHQRLVLIKIQNSNN